ncbi:hypothetical protein ABW38_00545 [Achromobacter xylosoxidans]|nr:hypothetical protein ABW35_15915 [Achromobacter xylosoxidans]KOQ31016.1 hypothetical protein ABW34_02310 [Achromobacter xylosoxidans]KOQ45211.1 hypothetical protein ABW37_06985 [Achromobacter xylosoxidans]KOQ50621.1 hypothetical protein ABW39_05050 [Achromobacter xylosoxidans]KOQ54457.1 hypothetical protein ABW38_00545 [Achromobacter xylosoxidans]
MGGDKGDGFAILAAAARRVDEGLVEHLVVALQHALGHEPLHQRHRAAGRLCDLLHGPTQDAVFFLVVHETHDVQPGALFRMCAAAQVAVPGPVAGVELE